MTAGTAGKKTCGYEHYAVRVAVGTAGKETCGYEGRAPPLTAGLPAAARPIRPCLCPIRHISPVAH